MPTNGKGHWKYDVQKITLQVGPKVAFISWGISYLLPK